MDISLAQLALTLIGRLDYSLPGAVVGYTIPVVQFVKPHLKKRLPAHLHGYAMLGLVFAVALLHTFLAFVSNNGAFPLGFEWLGIVAFAIGAAIVAAGLRDTAVSLARRMGIGAAFAQLMALIAGNKPEAGAVQPPGDGL